MSSEQQSFYKDGEIAARILNVISDAKTEVVLVTPYIDLIENRGKSRSPWHHAQTALEQAARNRVKITVLIRHNDDSSERHPKQDREDSIDLLLKNGARVLLVANLHAKIYMNESVVVISSMNLTEYSATNSHEIALLVQDSAVQQQIRDYVSQLMSRATQLNPGTPVPSGRPLRKAQQPAIQASTGTCIRCGEAIPRNPDRPLCDGCYEKWAEWENEDYEEKYCHLCGKRAETSYAKPLCRDCYRRAT